MFFWAYLIATAPNTQFVKQGNSTNLGANTPKSAFFGPLIYAFIFDKKKKPLFLDHFVFKVVEGLQNFYNVFWQGSLVDNLIIKVVVVAM